MQFSNQQNHIFSDIDRAATLPLFQRKSFINKLIIQARKCQQMFLRACCQILLSQQYYLIKQVLNFLKVYMSKNFATSNQSIYGEIIVIIIKRLPNFSNQLQNVSMDFLYHLLHNEKIGFDFVYKLCQATFEQIKAGHCEINLVLIQEYFSYQNWHKKLPNNSSYQSIDISRHWKQFQYIFLIHDFADGIIFQDSLYGYLLTIRIFTFFLQFFKNRVINLDIKQQIIGRYKNLLFLLNTKMFDQFSDKLVATEYLSEYLQVGIIYGLFEIISENDSIIQALLKITKQYGILSLANNKFWAVFLPEIRILFLDRKMDFLFELQKVFCNNIWSVEEQRQFQNIGLCLKTVDNFLQCHRKSFYANLPIQLKNMRHAVNPENIPTILIVLESLYTLPERKDMQGRNKKIQVLIKNFLNSLNYILDQKDLSFNKKRYQQLALNLPSLKILMSQRFWLLKQFFIQNNSYYFNLLQFFFSLLRTNEIKDQAYNLLKLLIDSKAKLSSDPTFEQNFVKNVRDCINIFIGLGHKQNQPNFLFGLKVIQQLAYSAQTQYLSQFILRMIDFAIGLPFHCSQLKRIISKNIRKYSHKLAESLQIMQKLFNMILQKNKTYYIECLITAFQCFKSDCYIMDILNKNYDQITNAIINSENQISQQLKFLEILVLKAQLSQDIHKSIINQIKQKIFHLSLNQDQLGRVINILSQYLVRKNDHLQMNKKLTISIFQCLTNVLFHLYNNVESTVIFQQLLYQHARAFALRADHFTQYIEKDKNRLIQHTLDIISKFYFEFNFKTVLDVKKQDQTKNLQGYTIINISKAIARKQIANKLFSTKNLLQMIKKEGKKTDKSDVANKIFLIQCLKYHRKLQN